MDDYVKCMVGTIPLLMNPGDTLMDELNLHIKYFKGVDIVTYYTPTDPTKDKEPMLNKTLQKKWHPQKIVMQKRLLDKESEMIGKTKLKQGPAEREKSQKNEEKKEADETSAFKILFMQCQPHAVIFTW